MAAAHVLSTHKPKDYGPGPSIILSGDEQLGYFGQVGASLVATSAELSALAGYTQGVAISDTSPMWLKFIDNGKVLFVSKRPLRHSVTVEEMQRLGIRLGKMITLKGRQFKIRLMTGGNADPATVAGGEWDRLMYPICVARPAGVPAWDGFSPADLGINTNSSSGGATFCQEKWASNNYYTIRGFTGLTYGGGGNNIGSNGGVFGWRPVLELVL